MLCYIFLISLVLPPFSLGKEETKENKTTIVCDKPDVIEAGDKFFDSFNKYVMYSSDKNNPVYKFKPNIILEYVKVANKSCYYDTRDIDRDAMEFIKLVEYSVRNGEFQDFVNNSGVECIAAVKSKISNCIKIELGTVAVEESNKHNETRKYDDLWKMTRLPIDKKTCKATDRIKHCTQKAMRDEGGRYCKYENNNIVYVGSLFNYVLERCWRLVPNWMELNQEQNNRQFEKKITKSTRTTHALLGVLLALAVLAIFYVCVRDCRSPKGQWKAMNDRISMSMMNRRRSLVNNEARQD